MSNRTCKVESCGKPFKARGYCMNHYHQAARAGEFTPGITDPVARFWSKVDKSGDCWEWTGTVDRGGYGNFYAGPNDRAAIAHRWALKATGIDIPEGAYVDHICRNRACVKPEHLRFVTKKQNGENRSGPRADNHSGYLGVSWNRRKRKWSATVGHNGKNHSAGLFASPEEANEAVVALRNRLFTHNDRDRQNSRP